MSSPNHLMSSPNHCHIWCPAQITIKDAETPKLHQSSLHLLLNAHFSPPGALPGFHNMCHPAFKTSLTHPTQQHCHSSQGSQPPLPEAANMTYKTALLPLHHRTLQTAKCVANQKQPSPTEANGLQSKKMCPTPSICPCVVNT